jgi:hypothetical protein
MLDQAMKLTEQFDCNTEITKKLLSYLTEIGIKTGNINLYISLQEI